MAKRKVSEPEEKQCPTCEGTGQTDCFECGADGACTHCGEGSCPECDRGHVSCDECGGLKTVPRD